MIFAVSMGPSPLQASVAKAGGPYGAMATLDNAMESVLGYQTNIRDQDAPKLVLLPKPVTKEEIVAETLRQLLLQHMQDRLHMKQQARDWRQQLHLKHKEKYQEEFDKYSRATLVNCSKPMQDAAKCLPQKGNPRLLRREVPNLFKLMVKSDDANQPPPSVQDQRKSGRIV